VTRDVRILWAGQGVSSVGNAVSALALPFVALLDLHAHAWQVGLLSACAFASYAVLALPVGAWLDRRTRRPFVLAGDLGRGLALGSIPIAHALGLLTLTQLVVVALVVGAFSVVFDVAYQSWLPGLVDPGDLVAANGRLGATDSAGRLIGPGVAGLLVAAIGASATVGLDAVSFVAAGAATLAVRNREKLHGAAAAGGGSALAGLRWLTRQTALRAVVACTATANLFVATWLAAETVFLIRTLNAGTTVTGAVLGLGSAGGVFGGLLAARVSQRLGSARTLLLCAAAGGPCALLAVVTTDVAGPWALSFGLLGITATAAIYGAGSVSYRQQATPPALLARVTAAIRVTTYGVLPLGALLGGVLASTAGPRDTLLIAAAGYGSSALWLLPFARTRDLPLSGSLVATTTARQAIA